MPYDFDAMRRDGIPDSEIARGLVERGEVQQLAGMGGLDYNKLKKDGISDLDIAGYILGKGQPLKQLPSEGMDFVKGVGSGLAEGAIGGTVGFPMDMMNLGPLAAKVLGMPPASPAAPFQPSDAARQAFSTHGISKTLGTDYEPYSEWGKLGKATAAGATSMLPGKLASTGLRMLLGSLLGASGEAGAKFFGDTVPGRAAGQVLPLSLMAFMAMREPQIVKSIKGDVTEVGEQGIKDAAEVAKQTEKTLGVRPSLPQAIPTKTAMSGTLAEVGRTPEGLRIRQLHEAQLPVAEIAARDFNNQLSPWVTDITGGANRVAAAVEKAAQRPEDIRSMITKPFFREAKRETLQPSIIPSMADMVRDVAKKNQFPSTSESGKAVESLAKAVEGTAKPSVILGPNGKPLQQPVPSMSLEVLKREAQTKGMAKADQGESAAAAAAIANKGGAAAIRQGLKGTKAEAADTMHKRATEAIVEPAGREPLATIRDTSFQEGGPAKWASFTKIMTSSDYGPRDVAAIGERLRKADPEAFPLIAKKAFEDRAEAAFTQKSGRTAQAAIGDYSSLWGVAGSKQRGVAEEMVRQTALSRGKDPDAAVDGARRLFDALSVISREREFAGQVARGDIRQTAGSTAATPLLWAASVAPLIRTANMVERVVQRNTYKKIADVLTSKEGVDTLLEIGRYNQPQEIAKTIARGIVGANAQMQGAPGTE